MKEMSGPFMFVLLLTALVFVCGADLLFTFTNFMNCLSVVADAFLTVYWNLQLGVCGTMLALGSSNDIHN